MSAVKLCLIHVLDALVYAFGWEVLGARMHAWLGCEQT